MGLETVGGVLANELRACTVFVTVRAHLFIGRPRPGTVRVQRPSAMQDSTIRSRS
jgi:hypothetical protein